MNYFFKNIEIHNFRGIDFLKIDDFEKINVLVGSNNVGKTSILEALFMLTGMSNPLMPARINYLRTLSSGNLDETRYLFHNLNFTNKPLLKGETNNGQRRLTFEPRLINDAANSSSSNSYLHSSIKRLNFDFDMADNGEFLYHSMLTLNKNGKFQPTTDRNYAEQMNCIFLPTDKNDKNATTNFATLSKILCKWKQDSVVSLFLYPDSVFKYKHKLVHDQSPV